MYNPKRLIKLTQDLIKIDSQNPPGDEKEIAFFVKNTFSKCGLSTRLIEFGKNRFNTITILKGRSSKASLVITPHLDTVPFGKNWKFPPRGAKIYSNRVYGRGATDCKGNLAVGMEVLRTLKEEKIKLNYDIIFLATADEEAGSHYGLIPLLKKHIIKSTYAIILDSDDYNIIIAQKGMIHLKIAISGKMAHGAYPNRGVNAILLAVKSIEKIKKLKFSYKKHRLLKPPTINIGTIKGGDKVNMVADWCEFEVDIRFLPGMDSAKIIKAIRNIVGFVTPEFNLEITAVQNPCQIDPDHLLVRSLKQASLEQTGQSRIKGSEGATVMTFFDEQGIPVVATGFGSSGCCHIVDEYVKIDNLIGGYKMLRDFLFILDKKIN